MGFTHSAREAPRAPSTSPIGVWIKFKKKKRKKEKKEKGLVTATHLLKSYASRSHFPSKLNYMCQGEAEPSTGA